MDKKVKRVLVTGVSNIGIAGVATIVYKWGQNIDSNFVIYDYLAQRGIKNTDYRNAIQNKGGKIHTPNNNKKNVISKAFSLMNWVYKVIKENEYSIIHINSDSSYMAAIYIWIAKRAKVSHIIVHSHSTMIDDINKIRRRIKIFLHKLSKGYVLRNCDVKLACSKQASKWMFDNYDAIVIPNGIELEKYRYDEECRKYYRDELGLVDKKIIGCVGRLAYQKNYDYSLRIIREIINRRKDIIFMIIGEGEDRLNIEKLIKEYNLEENCLLLGNRSDVNKLLSCMDIFLLPSRFEGLGIVYIEAQASGMPVFASDVVPEEAFVTPLIHKHALDESPSVWAEDLLLHIEEDRRDYIAMIKEAGYTAEGAAQKLEKIYCSLS